MRNNLPYYLLTFCFVIFIGCQTDNNKTTAAGDSAKTKVTVGDLKRNESALKTTFNEDDLPLTEYLQEKIKPIRANFKRINAIKAWTSIKTKDIWETTEGGEASYYYRNGELEKMTTKQFGETFQQVTAYYLIKGEPSFVLEKLYKYNRPMYYDTTAMKENNDTEAFDFNKSTIIEDRSYFDKGKLIHQITDKKNKLTEEQKRIIAEFEKLILLEKSK